MYKNKYFIFFIIAIFCIILPYIYSEEKIFKFDQKRWNRVRSRIEQNLSPYEEDVSTSPLQIPPVAKPTTIEFIEGTQLNIAGRKLIAVELNTTQYPNKPEYNRTDVSMKQELQVRIQGKVGERVEVNIDIDDTKPDKRDISIIYRGEGVEATPGAVGYRARPGAVIQEIAFGDITLSLPHTEFVGYSRQVFGIRAIGQYRNAKLYLIASQSKGAFETQRFTGTTQFERRILLDTSYIRRKYYNILFDEHKIRPGSVKVYLDDIDSTNDINTVTLTVQPYKMSVSTYTGKFDILSIGKDYIVDYIKGIIIFNRSIQQNYVIAIDYIDDTTGKSLKEENNQRCVMIKDMLETPEITRELLNRYSIGRKNIVRDDGRGNFILKITDKSNRPLDPKTEKIYPGEKEVPEYPKDIIVDFENGEFHFVSSQPFATDCYHKIPVSRYNILVEYRYRVKTYFLKPFIVPQSERVVIDGKLLSRDIDYFIDYDSGLLTFLKEELITETSVIDVSYEYSMLGLQGGETLLGGRLEVPLTRNLFIGSSWLGNVPSKGTNVPDVRSTPSSLQVWEADSRLVDFKIPLVPLKIDSISAEYAESKKNPNVWNKAIIENMEGIDQVDGVSTYRELWYYSSVAGRYFPEELNWENEEIPVKDINPYKETITEKQQVLKINYNLVKSTEVSMVYQFSKIGRDFTKKLYIEMDIYSDGGGGKLFLDLGQVKEDIDDDGILDSEDKNRNGILDLGEDTGIEYSLPDGRKFYIGSNNGRLDTEDIDSDGILKTVDDVYTLNLGELHFIGWVSTRVVVNVSDIQKWTNIKHARIRIESAGKRGVTKIAKISLVGIKWENQSPDKCSLFAVNNENELRYKKLTELEEYSELYGDRMREDPVEQALAIKYNFTNIQDSATCYLLYTKAQSFIYHHKVNFFLFNDGNIIEFKFRAYTDMTNYVEFSTITVPWKDEWKKFSIIQKDINYDNIPDRWIPDENNPNGGICVNVSTPNLNSISKLEIIIKPTSPNQTGVVYVNDIYLSESWQREGIAKKLDLNFSVPGWVNFGGYHKSIERDFETFTSAITNQDRIENSGYINFTKINVVPLNFQGKQSQTITPSAIKAGDIVSSIEEGELLTTEGKINTGLNLPKLPQVGVSYTKSVSSSTHLQKTDITDSYNATLSYRNPLYKIIPITNLSLSYGESKLLVLPWAVEKATSAVDNTKNISLNIPFSFWSIATLNLTAGTKNVFTEEKKSRRDISSELIIPRLTPESNVLNYWSKLVFFPVINFPQVYPEILISSYPKLNEWKVGGNSTINILPFFKPTLDYNMDISENYNFPVSDKKTVLRNASGGGNVNFSPRSVINFKYTQSMNLGYSYRLTAGDRYENLPKDVEVIDLYNFRKLENLWFEKEISTFTGFRVQWLDQRGQRVSLSWNIFEGFKFMKPIRFLQKTTLTMNYNDELRKEEITKTEKVTYTKMWPELYSTFYDIDELATIFTDKSFITDSRLDLKYTLKTTEIKKVSFDKNINHRETLSFNLFRKYSVMSSYENTYSENFSYIHNRIIQMSDNHLLSLQVGMPLWGYRLTSRYDFSKEYTEDSRRIPTRDIVTHTVSARYYMDIPPKPGGVNLPLVGNIPLRNRLIIDTNLQYSRKESPLDLKTNNVDIINISANADYEVSKFVKLRFGTGGQMSINRYVHTETFYKYNLNGQLTIIF